MRTRNIKMAVSLLMMVAVLVTACGPTATEAPSEPTATEAPVKEFEGEMVSVIATWGGDEQESFMAMVAPWEEETGATEEYEGTRDLNAV